MLPRKFHKTRHRRSPQHHNQEGFTLLELMVSMVILGIAIVSIIAMQSTSLQSHMQSQNMMTANSLADQFLELAQSDALMWNRTTEHTSTWMFNNQTKKAMQTATAKATKANKWNIYTPAPVNFQLRTKNDGTSGRGARFCIFYSYSWAGGAIGVTRLNQQMMEVTVSVVWPRRMGGLSKNYHDFFKDCGTSSPSKVQEYLWNAKYTPYFQQIRRTTFLRRGVMDL